MPARKKPTLEALQQRIETLDGELVGLKRDIATLDRSELSSEIQRLEVEKLRSENRLAVAEAEKTELERNALKKFSFPWFTSAIVAVVTPISIVVTLGYGVWNFIEQRDERAKFTVTKEVIELVDRLENSDPGKIAILLSAYGEPAVPIFLLGLRDTARPKVIKAMTQALVLVAEKEADWVVPTLAAEAESLTRAVVETGKSETANVLLSYISALSEVGKNVADRRIGNAIDDTITKLACGPDESKKPRRLDKDDWKTLCKKLEDSK